MQTYERPIVGDLVGGVCEKQRSLCIKRATGAKLYSYCHTWLNNM